MSTRNAYESKLEARIAQRRAEIDALQARVREANADARIALEREIRNLEDKQQQLRGKLDELREASDDAWKEVKQGVERAWKELESAFSSAAGKF